MGRRALVTSTAGLPSPQHHPVTTVGAVSLHPQQQQAAGWHSPVPYLFGGLAAMLGLIAFALLILACSYWKLSSFPESSSDADSGGEKPGGEAGKAADEGREMSNVVVIMAGQLKPTFIATPATSRSSSFGDSVNGDHKGATDTSCTSSSDDTDQLSSSEDDLVQRGNIDHHNQLQLQPNPTPGDLPV